MTKTLAQTVETSIDAGELPGMERTWSAYRKDIDKTGTRNVFDGFGSATIRVNGRGIALVQLRENTQGRAVIALYGIDSKGNQGLLAEFDLEAAGVVPPRVGRRA